MKQYDIYYVDFDPTIGSEIQKKRPCVIVNADCFAALPLKVVLPITGWNNSFATQDWKIKINPSSINGLHKISAVDCLQIRCIDEQRFAERIGQLEDFYIEHLTEALADLLSIPTF